MIAFSMDEYPLVLFDMGGADRTATEIRDAFAGFRNVNNRARGTNSRYVIIAMTRLTPTAQERRVIAEEANRFSPADRALCACAVIIVQNGLVRGVMTALGWMMPSFRSIIELAPSTGRAVELAASRLQALGTPMSEEQIRRAQKWFGDSERGGSIRPAGTAGG
jgi:hypothetical protein